MSMTVKRRRDSQTPRVFVHKTADIRGGVSVASSELGGDFLREGAILSAPIDGVTHVVKIGQVAAEVASDAKTIQVKKLHCFKVGDILMKTPGALASRITAIDDSNSQYDTITLAAAIGAVAKGGLVAEAKATSTGTTSELKYEPQSVTGTGKPIDPTSNINTDAWVIGVTKGNLVPDYVDVKLKGIVNL